MKMIRRSGLALGLVAAMGLAACTREAPDIAGPDAVPGPSLGVAVGSGPTLVGTRPLTSYGELGAVRFRNFYRLGGGDVYEGVVSLNTGARRVAVNLNNGAVEDPGSTSGDCAGNWSSGTTAAAPADNQFTFTWDRANDQLVTTITNTNVSCTLTFPSFTSVVATERFAGDVAAATTALSNVTYLKFFVVNRTGVTVDLASLALDGTHDLGDIAGTFPATEKWVIDYDFDVGTPAGFTVSGTFKLGRDGTSDPCGDESCKVEIAFGTPNYAPTASAGGPYSGGKGSAISITGTASDADNYYRNPLLTTWSFATGSGTGCTIATPSALNTTVTCTDDGSHTLQLAVSDGLTSVTATATLTVLSNQPPTANPGGPYLGAINTAIAFDGTGSSDPDSDPLTYAWTFGDNSDAGTVATPTHSYAAAGIYDVCLTVDDGTVNSAPVCTIAVVYDPTGGFVTGGGWINSPAGAYVADRTLAGRANFGFVSKYLKGATVPTGNTEFQFHAAGLNFHSSSYNWLVVNRSGLNAQFKGVGRLNGVDGYKFMIWATDKSKLNGTTDTFRIQITDGSDVVVYDNGTEQAIAGGSIVVHTGK